ncbi:MAG: VOC family protein [Myxococcota bacterium]
MTNQSIRTQIHVRLVIDGVDEALRFYTEVFGAELLERFEDNKGAVVHAALKIGESTISVTEHSQYNTSASVLGSSPVILGLTLDDPDTICARMVERGSEVIFPIANQHYGKREGRIRDPFGHLWILSRPIEELDNEEIQRRLSEMG